MPCGHPCACTHSEACTACYSSAHEAGRADKASAISPEHRAEVCTSLLAPLPTSAGALQPDLMCALDEAAVD